MSIRYSLLALLSEAPAFGLQLREEFEKRTGEVWPLNVGQVYSTLQRLERDGLIVADGGEGPQKAYRITDAGRSALLAWLGPPDAVEVPPRDELVIKIMVALRVPGVDAADLVQAHRSQLVRQMQHFTHLKEDTTAADLHLLLVADAETYRLDAMIRWLEAVEARVRQAGTDPAPPPAVPAARSPQPAVGREPRR
ncbi:MAG TPA: helix-turn-helix transcriptional regulator [Egicoccus sp.]|nr:helix-turn-helix transcriptional regulator [Egicoccus sp.]HSK23806.1 helix-turn-helix transcriptional regulator [Egicoccus sp.]